MLMSPQVSVMLVHVQSGQTALEAQEDNLGLIWPEVPVVVKRAWQRVAQQLPAGKCAAVLCEEYLQRHW